MPKEPRTDPLSHLLQPLHAFAVNLSTWNIPSATIQSLGSFQVFMAETNTPCLYIQKAPTKTMGHGEVIYGTVINDLSSSKTFGNSKVMSFSFPLLLLLCVLWWIYSISFYYIIWSLSVYPTANQHWRFRWNAWNHHFVNLCAGTCLS